VQRFVLKNMLVSSTNQRDVSIRMYSTYMWLNPWLSVTISFGPHKCHTGKWNAL
jgi:hypothetical protein